MIFRCTPTHAKIPRNQKIKKVFCGPDCSIAISTDGYLLACGLNTNNKLGLSTFFRYCEKSLTFIPVKLNRKVRDVAMGRNHTVVLTEDGFVMTIGKNREGQLGRGNLKDDTYFREVKGFSKHAIKVNLKSLSQRPSNKNECILGFVLWFSLHYCWSE